MNAIPQMHKLSQDMWLVETPENEGLRTVSLHIKRGGKHVWLWMKLVAGTMPKTAFPQFQRPLPALEDVSIHEHAEMPMSEVEDNTSEIQIGSEKFKVDGDTVTVSGFAETDKILTACLNSRTPFFRWESRT